jgi:tetratricopeptide (TPR) repeat protein
MNFLSMKKAWQILMLALCLGAGAPVWASGSQFVARGDAAYNRKAYDSAVSYYSRAAEGKDATAVIFYKLGNAHYRLRHTGEAMLAYQRALLRQPAFPAAAKNAQLIQNQVSPAARNEVFFLRWWQSLTAPSLTNLWAVLAIVVFAALLLGLGWRQFQRKGNRLQPQIILAGLVLASLFAVFSFAGAKRYQPHSAGVVMRGDVRFRPVAQSEGGTGVSLPEGLLLKVLSRTKSSLIVRLPDGQEGLVQEADIALVN